MYKNLKQRDIRLKKCCELQGSRVWMDADVRRQSCTRQMNGGQVLERGADMFQNYLKEKRSTSNVRESKCNESSRISKLMSASCDGGVDLLRPLGVMEPHIPPVGEKDLRGVDGSVCPKEILVGRSRSKPRPRFKFWFESKMDSRVLNAGKSGAPSMLLLLVTNRMGI